MLIQHPLFTFAAERLGVEFLDAHFARTEFSSGCGLLICAQNSSQEAMFRHGRVRGCENGQDQYDGFSGK